MRAPPTVVTHHIAIGPAPDYLPTFGNTGPRMHKNGHLWLNNEASPPSLRIQLWIDTPNFLFATCPAGDGSAAMFISQSCDPASLKAFDGDGAFANPVLDKNNARLSFDVVGFNSKVYYYCLNILHTTTRRRIRIDPIIVNK